MQVVNGRDLSERFILFRLRSEQQLDVCSNVLGTVRGSRFVGSSYNYCIYAQQAFV